MIGRVLGGTMTLLVYLAAATLIAELIVLGYLWAAWKMDVQRLARVVAVARGDSAEGKPDQGNAAHGQVPPAEPSYQEIVQRRAVMLRDLELRESSLKSAVEELKLQQDTLAKDREQLAQQSQDFDTRVAAILQGAQATGLETVRSTLASVKPKQAKDLILDMLDKKETRDVVLLLSEMNESKRAKIVGEFKTPEESEKIAEVLRLIREGEPQSALAGQAQQERQGAPTGGT